MEPSEPRLIETASLRYLLATPAARAPGGAPVLCFLHGHGEGAPAEIRAALTAHGPLRAESRAHVAARFIVVAPQLPVAGDRWHRHADAVRAIVERARDEHGGDARRTYLTGFSFGGNGVFDLALAQPGAWAALWAVDPTRPPARDPGRPVWLSVGEVARLRAPGFARVLGLRELAAPGAGDRVMLDEGCDHVGCATRAYQDARVYDWLLARRL